jgi:hypothetical protein
MTPVLAVDDTRNHGPTAPNHIDGAVEGQSITGAAPGDVYAIGLQLLLQVPPGNSRDLKEISAPIFPYALRVRGAAFHAANDWLMGPLTVGLQRYFAVDAVVLTTAADAHIGIEAAFSTPWLSGRHTLPPAPVRIGHGVDTELTQSGWSLRPVSAYFRGDFLACRSFFLDVGAAPEWFAPTTGANEFDLRFHVATGWSFGCTAKADGYYPKFTAEYRGRTRLHADDAPVGYWDSVGAGLQFDMGRFLLQILMTSDPGKHFLSPLVSVIRIQGGYF